MIEPNTWPDDSNDDDELWEQTLRDFPDFVTYLEQQDPDSAEFKAHTAELARKGVERLKNHMRLTQQLEDVFRKLEDENDE